MATVGINFRIDVTKIDKARLFKGAKGTYLDMTAFVDLDKKDQYDNNGFITQQMSKEEREQKVQLPILGNSRVFYDDSKQAQQQTPQLASPSAGPDYLDDDIPF